jgi:hypothetical protein
MWRNPRTWKWPWLIWQVLSPLLGPIVVSLFAALLLKTMQHDVPLNRDVIVDVTPWALIFFTLALLGGGFHDIWPTLGTHKILFGFLLVETLAVFMYVETTVTWRLQHPGVVPDEGVWVAAFIMLISSIVICHEAAA